MPPLALAVDAVLLLLLVPLPPPVPALFVPPVPVAPPEPDLQAGFQPPNISTPAWNAIFPSLQAQVGTTWGDFVQRIDDDALYLGHLGEKVNDISQLWSFEVQQAIGFSPLGTLFADSGFDAATQFEFLGDRKLANLWKLLDMARTFDRSGLFGLADFIQR